MILLVYPCVVSSCRHCVVLGLSAAEEDYKKAVDLYEKAATLSLESDLGRWYTLIYGTALHCVFGFEWAPIYLCCRVGAQPNIFTRHA
jgi:hypothetical protein